MDIKVFIPILGCSWIVIRLKLSIIWEELYWEVVEVDLMQIKLFKVLLISRLIMFISLEEMVLRRELMHFSKRFNKGNSVLLFVDCLRLLIMIYLLLISHLALRLLLRKLIRPLRVLMLRVEVLNLELV